MDVTAQYRLRRGAGAGIGDVRQVAPARDDRAAMPRCEIVPAPIDESLYLPGSFFNNPMTCLASLTGILLDTTSTAG